MINYYNIMVLLLCSLVFFSLVSTNNFKSSKAVLATCKSFTSTSPQIWFGKEDISPETWQKMRELYYIYMLYYYEHFESKKENWRHFSLEFLLNLCGFFYSPKQFWVVNTFYHSMSTYHIYIQHCGLICLKNWVKLSKIEQYWVKLSKKVEIQIPLTFSCN